MEKESHDVMGNIFSKATSSTSACTQEADTTPTDPANPPDPDPVGKMTTEDNSDDDDISIASAMMTNSPSDDEDEGEDNSEEEEGSMEEVENPDTRGSDAPPSDSLLGQRNMIEDISRKINPLEAGQLVLDIIHRKMRTCQSKQSAQILHNASLILFAAEEGDEGRFHPRTRDAECQVNTDISPTKSDASQGISEQMLRNLEATKAALKLLTNSDSSTSLPSVTTAVNDDDVIPAKKRKADDNNNPANASPSSSSSSGQDGSAGSSSSAEGFEEERTKLMNLLCQARLEGENAKNQLDEAMKERARMEEATGIAREEAEREIAGMREEIVWLELEVGQMKEDARNEKMAAAAAVATSSSSFPKGDCVDISKGGQERDIGKNLIRVRDFSGLFETKENLKEGPTDSAPVATTAETSGSRDLEVEVVEPVLQLPTKCTACQIMLYKERQYKSHMTSDYHMEQVKKSKKNLEYR